VKVKLPQLSRKLCTEETPLLGKTTPAATLFDASAGNSVVDQELCATANGVDIPQLWEVLAVALIRSVETHIMVYSEPHTGVSGLDELSFLLHSVCTLKAYSV